MRWQSADGPVLQGWSGGEAEGTLVAVLHGCPDTRHVAVTGHDAARAVGVRLLCVNRPGYGRSTVHPSTLGTVAAASDASRSGRPDDRFVTRPEVPSSTDAADRLVRPSRPGRPWGDG